MLLALVAHSFQNFTPMDRESDIVRHIQWKIHEQQTAAFSYRKLVINIHDIYIHIIEFSPTFYDDLNISIHV